MQHFGVGDLLSQGTGQHSKKKQIVPCHVAMPPLCDRELSIIALFRIIKVPIILKSCYG